LRLFIWELNIFPSWRHFMNLIISFEIKVHVLLTLKYPGSRIIFSFFFIPRIRWKKWDICSYLVSILRLQKSDIVRNTIDPPWHYLQHFSNCCILKMCIAFKTPYGLLIAFYIIMVRRTTFFSHFLRIKKVVNYSQNWILLSILKITNTYLRRIKIPRFRS